MNQLFTKHEQTELLLKKNKCSFNNIMLQSIILCALQLTVDQSKLFCTAAAD